MNMVDIYDLNLSQGWQLVNLLVDFRHDSRIDNGGACDGNIDV